VYRRVTAAARVCSTAPLVSSDTVNGEKKRLPRQQASHAGPPGQTPRAHNAHFRGAREPGPPSRALLPRPTRHHKIKKLVSTAHTHVPACRTVSVDDEASVRAGAMSRSEDPTAGKPSAIRWIILSDGLA
jgi:hypothetical protein